MIGHVGLLESGRDDQIFHAFGAGSQFSQNASSRAIGEFFVDIDHSCGGFERLLYQYVGRLDLVSLAEGIAKYNEAAA